MGLWVQGVGSKVQASTCHTPQTACGLRKATFRVGGLWLWVEGSGFFFWFGFAGVRGVYGTGSTWALH